MKYVIAILMIGILLFAIPLFGQSSTVQKEPAKVTADAIGKSHIDNKFSLFDLSRLEMRQSYSIGYFSTSGRGNTIGMYMNSMRYRISNPLTLNVNLVWLHEPGSLLSSNKGAPANYGRILPSFSLEYRPSSKFYFSVGYYSMPVFPASDYQDEWPGSYMDHYFRPKH